jgi:CheY-like chemotaxis protein
MNRRILVVDDDPEAKRAATEVLESHGYQVLTPPNGQIALEQVLSGRPWVVIAGETLPGSESGLDFVDRIAQALPSLPPPGFIVLQDRARGGLEGMSAYRATRVDMYLAKPFNRLELLSFVVRLSNAIEARHERNTSG